jgi:superfamily I DNA and/or RNA helicase
MKQEIVKKAKMADVVRCTLDALYSNSLFDGMSFPYVIIDDSTQACEPQCLYTH